MDRLPGKRILAVRTNDYVARVGTSPYIGLPREEIDRLYGSVEVHSFTPEDLVRERASYLALTTYTAVHYNYSWLTFERAEKALGLSATVFGETEPPVFLDASFERVARRSLDDAKILAGLVDWRLAGLIRRDQIGLVYIARLRQHWSPEHNHSRDRVVAGNNGELTLGRSRFDAWSQLLIDNLAGL